MEKINDPDEFKKFLDKESIKTVLIGNGFSKAHPSLGGCFTFNSLELLKVLEQKHLILGKSLSGTNCPEKFLDEARLVLSELILKSYISKLIAEIDSDLEADWNFTDLFNAYKNLNYRALNVLKKFEKIFTVNYDPLIYFELLQEIGCFTDGFRSGFTDQKKVNNYKKKKTKVFYLHGSWFIVKNKDGEIGKLSFGGSPSNQGEIAKIKNMETLFNWQSQTLPFLILEDRWQQKQLLTEDSNNLNSQAHYT